jgi:opacity protein-like surface antigen
VGWLPVKKRLNLFARLGVGSSRFKLPSGQSFSADSVNWGVGAQYSVTEKNGVRVEYLQQDFHESRGVANRWSLSFVRRFF